MVAEVSAVQAAKAEKVYSDDGMLYSGMTVRDAGKNSENMKVFDYADRDKDGVISDAEFNRYNGPVLVENTANGQTKAYENGYAGIFPQISPEEVEYYPGLNIEDVNDKGRVTFTKLDKIKKDGVLSLEEIQNAVSVKNNVDNAKQQMKNEAKASKRGKSLFDIGYVLSCAGITVAGLGLAVSLAKDCVITMLMVQGGTVALTIGLPLAIGAGIYAYFSRNKNAKNNVADNKNLAKQLEEKYKNDEYAKQLINAEVRPLVEHQQYEEFFLK